MSIVGFDEQTITFSAQYSGKYSLLIYSADGRLVNTVFHSFFTSGVHTVIWNRKNLGSGVVIVMLSSGDYKIAGKYVLR